MIDIVKIEGVLSVYATGDLHGDFKDILGFIKRYDLKDCVVIFCGDIAIGFYKDDYYKQIFSKIKRELKKRNVYILFERGNHDSPQEFNSDKWKKDKYLKTLRDYSVININNNFNILAVGGGLSIDRTFRLTEMDKRAFTYRRYHGGTFEEALKNCPQLYWPDEMPVYDEEKINEIKENNITINAVCTHTSPSFCVPLTKEGVKGWFMVDEKLAEDLDTERQTMTNLYNKLVGDNHPLTKWCYGHFHFHHFEHIDNVDFYLLDMDRKGVLDFVEIYRDENIIS